MKPTEQHSCAPQKIYIDGEMTIYRAAEMKRTLLTPITERAMVEFDLSRVTALDSSGVQLLMLAVKTARVMHSELRLVAKSAVVMDVMDVLDLGLYFNDQPSDLFPDCVTTRP
jgi:anti-sigma B factor antagonist